MKITAKQYLAMGGMNKDVIVKNGDKVVEAVVKSMDGTYYEVKHTDGTWADVVEPFTVEVVKPDQSE